MSFREVDLLTSGVFACMQGRLQRGGPQARGELMISCALPLCPGSRNSPRSTPGLFCPVMQAEEGCKVKCLQELHAYKVRRPCRVSAAGVARGNVAEEAYAVKKEKWCLRVMNSVRCGAIVTRQLRWQGPAKRPCSARPLTGRRNVRPPQACVERIKSDDTGAAHCTGQYFDYWHCVDKCVSLVVPPTDTLQLAPFLPSVPVFPPPACFWLARRRSAAAGTCAAQCTSPVKGNLLLGLGRCSVLRRR